MKSIQIEAPLIEVLSTNTTSPIQESSTLSELVLPACTLPSVTSNNFIEVDCKARSIKPVLLFTLDLLKKHEYLKNLDIVICRLEAILTTLELSSSELSIRTKMIKNMQETLNKQDDQDFSHYLISLINRLNLEQACIVLDDETLAQEDNILNDLNNYFVDKAEYIAPEFYRAINILSSIQEPKSLKAMSVAAFILNILNTCYPESIKTNEQTGIIEYNTPSTLLDIIFRIEYTYDIYEHYRVNCKYEVPELLLQTVLIHSQELFNLDQMFANNIEADRLERERIAQARLARENRGQLRLETRCTRWDCHSCVHIR